MLRDHRAIAANSSRICQLLAALHIKSPHCVSTLAAALLVPPTMLMAVIYSVKQLPCTGHYVMADLCKQHLLLLFIFQGESRRLSPALLRAALCLFSAPVLQLSLLLHFC